MQRPRISESPLLAYGAVTHRRMSQTCGRPFEKKNKKKKKKKNRSPNTLGLVKNLGRIDLVLFCQTHVERVQNESWACFWRTSCVDCDANLRIAKSPEVSLTCLGRGHSLKPWARSKLVWDMCRALLTS